MYEVPIKKGALSLVNDTGEQINFHIAQACNIAQIISSIDRLLSLPRSNIACNEVAEVLLLTIDVLRENIKSASASDRYEETAADTNIKSWAGFIKHPRDYVFAHRCLFDTCQNIDPPLVTINSEFLNAWNGLDTKKKDARKSELAGRVVKVELPCVDELAKFFESCAKHLNTMIDFPEEA